MSALTNRELLEHYALILAELRARKVLRTSNAPTADYAEFLVAKTLGLELPLGQPAGYDALDQAGTRFQIKSRRLTPNNSSKQLGALRNLDAHEFDFLIAIVFAERYEVLQVVKIPHAIIASYARYSKHVNAHILQLGRIVQDPQVEDLTPLFLD